MSFMDLCDCHCHEDGRNIKHIMACCYRCPHCRKNIDTVCYDKHCKKCGDAKEAWQQAAMDAVDEKKQDI